MENGNNNKQDALKNIVEKAVKKQGPDVMQLSDDMIQNLEQNLNIYHSELLYQNDELSRINQELNMMNEELRLSEKRYTDLYELAPVAYLIFDLEGWILSVNWAFCRLIGQEKRNIYKYKLSKFLAAESQDAYYFFMQKMKRNIESVEKLELVFHNDKKDIPTEVYLNYYEENGIYFIRATVFDLTEIKGLMQQIQQEKERYQVIAEQAHDILFEYQVAEDIMIYSSRYRELTGQEPVIHHFIDSIIQDGRIFEEDIPKFKNFVEKVYCRHKSIHCDLRIRRTKNDYVWYRVIATVLFHEDKPVKVVGTITDINTIVRENESLKKVAQTDPLTHLYNKEMTKKAIEHFLTHEGVHGIHALFVIDLDNFKAINDRFGHLFGDTVLIEVSAKLQRVLGYEGIIGRIGGDEFVVLLKNCETEEIAVQKAEKICSAIKSILFSDKVDCHFSSSMGICMYPQSAVTYTDLFRKADIALYHAKHVEKNCYEIFHSNLSKDLKDMELLNYYGETEPHIERQYADLLFITNVIEILFESKEYNSSIQLILSMLGNYFKVDHISLAERNEELNCSTVTYQWCLEEENNSIKKDSFTDEDLKNYMQLFNSEGVFCCYDIDELKQGSYKIWKTKAENGVKALLEYALVDNGELKGFFTLESFHTITIWNQGDINSFMLIAKILSAYLMKLRTAEQSERYVTIDSLTNIWNFSKFSMEAAYYLASKQNKNSALISLDIRNFKYFNDQFGYEEGNTILILFSNALKEELKEKEMLARVSADQFIVLLQFETKTELQQRVTMLLEKLSHLQCLNLKNYKLAVICGVYIIRPEDREISTIVDRANIARKTEKKSHKSIAAYYNDEMERQLLAIKLIEDSMEEALANNEFFVVYQPKFKLSNSTITGAEALIRWNSPSMGQIYPDSFIPIVEKNGFVIELDFFVLNQVCSKISEWRKNKGKDICISVNFSRLHVALKDSLKRAEEIVDKWQLPHHLIEIEITESVFSNDADELLAYIIKLREAGFRIAMDDFGAGYSSLNLLKDLPLDVLKLDRNFFRHDKITRQEKIVVTNVVRMARQLGISIVTEGVETQEQADFLMEVGCETAQGYLFAKPMPVEEFEKLLNEKMQEN